MLRIDLFLPFLRRPKKGQPPRAPGRCARLARKLLPAALFSDPLRPRAGLVRRLLKKIGPVTYSAPLRRGVQALCFVLFLVFFFYVCWPYTASPHPERIVALGDGSVWPAHYAQDREAKEWGQAEFFLILDPLVAFSTALAGKAWVWSLAWAAGILAVCLIFPRGFCGYLCPLGTLIDLFDWSVGKRVERTKLQGDGWWVHLKYYLLAGILAASACGVLLSGFFAAIPVITRGLQFILAPLQMGFLRGWHQVPPLNAGHYLSIVLFLGVLGLGLLRKRFWCRYVCPSGAVFSVFNVFRAAERKVESSCIHCNKCVEICPFDAIKADFTTRTADCTLCQSCGGVCPTHAIKFVDRWDLTSLKKEDEPPTAEIPLDRRGFLAGTAASLFTVLGMEHAFGAELGRPGAALPVRPPGSVPEAQFLQLCIRCGECFKACPNNVLQPMGFKQGLEGLWTPEVVADWSGCESSCNNCGQVCPTGAIRALPLEEKRHARMGLAVVDTQACLPYANREACDLCVQECKAAGYMAIDYMQVHTQVDEDGFPVPDTGYLAPVVNPDLCVGCGLCQTRCYLVNKKDKGLLAMSAIVVEAGAGKEDRLTQGSYADLRRMEADARAKRQREFERQQGITDQYLPDFLK